VKCAIFDIDGTLANLEHRRGYLQKPKNYNAFKAEAKNDTLIEPVARVLNSLFNDNYIVLCSGRGEEQRSDTEAWLFKHDIYYHNLYMRKEKDYRADDIIKEEVLEQILADGYEPWIVFDDRQRVVDMWRRRGYICAQVAPGDF
jgi:phosphoglycolate phosphatase-like HAD superfamily hydrolase